MNAESTLSGWWVFAGILLLVAGLLNIIWGIAAIGDSKFFTANATYIMNWKWYVGWPCLRLYMEFLEWLPKFGIVAPDVAVKQPATGGG